MNLVDRVLGRRTRLFMAGAALAAAAVCTGPSVAPAVQLEEQSTQTVRAPENPRLDIQNRSGDTEVVAWDRADIEITVTRRARAHETDEAKALLKKLSVDVETSGNTVKVKAIYPERDLDARGFFGLLFSDHLQATVDLSIHVPRGSEAAVSSTSGGIKVRELRGPVRVDCTSGDVNVNSAGSSVSVDCTSGDVTLDRVSGDVRVRATSGNVSLEDVTGRTDVDATSGDITAKDLGSGGRIGTMSGDLMLTDTRGTLELSTASGDAEVDAHRGTLTAKSSSGNLEVALEAPLAGPYRFDSSSGSVTVRLPADPSCKLDLSTATGALHARLPLQVQEVNRNHLVAVAGDGAALVEVSTASGDVEVAIRGKE